MIFWRNKVLIVKSSSIIQFFKRETDEEDQCDKWTAYHSFESKGFVSGSKRSPKFQIIEEDYIRFYEIDLNDNKPKSVNVMLNFIQCGMIIFGEAGKYAISYKEDQPDLF